MNFQYASDLHLEFAQNKKTLSKRPLKPVAEILLLAGDIMPLADLTQHQDFLNYISDHFKMIYWLPGNHEYFGADLASWPSSFEESIRSNLLLLNNKVINFEDSAGPIQLIFSTLWSHIPSNLTDTVAKRMRDFGQIRLNGQVICPETYNQLHQKAVSFLESTSTSTKNLSNRPENSLGSKPLRKLVISHHLPSFLNYPKKHQNDPINVGFATNLDDFIVKMAPNAWIFGHHHVNIPPFLIGKTPLYTNQMGYIKLKKKQGFDRQAMLTI